jgi:hypothetical protein
MAPPDPATIELTLQQRSLACGHVVEAPYFTNRVATDYYLVRCSDGARYVYMQDYPNHQYSVATCADMRDRGVLCPD